MPRRSPLDDRHRALDAKLTEFGGWEMPLAYATGTVNEHLACRRRAVVFDVSHLGTVRVSGAEAFARLQIALTNDVGKIAPGRAQYTHLCGDDGSVLDDIIVWWIDATTFDVMPNASNTSRVLDALGGTDVTETRAVLAVQGPQARSLLAAVFPAASHVGRFKVEALAWGNIATVVAGTGYTGEDGVEISVSAEHAGELWDELVRAGGVPAGLGARDTLRLEAGLPLHGHELGPGITPLQAGLGWVVGWAKPAFRGKAALEAEKAAGPRRRLRGLAVEGRRPPRAGYPVTVGGAVAGEVTSGNYSPVLEHGIAFAFLPPAVEDGTAVSLDARGTPMAGRVVPTPFVGKH